MHRNLALYRYNWAWFLVGLMVFGVTAELIFGLGARYFWGAFGGTLFMVIGGLRAARRSKTARSASETEAGDEST